MHFNTLWVNDMCNGAKVSKTFWSKGDDVGGIHWLSPEKGPVIGVQELLALKKGVKSTVRSPEIKGALKLILRHNHNRWLWSVVS